jgi:hypothetical protein
MLVPSRFDHNRRSVPHTSNDCCVYGLPTFAGSVAKDQVAPIPAIRRGSEIGQVDPQQAFALTYRSDSPR